MMYLMKLSVTRFARCYAPWLSARFWAGCSFQDVDSEVRARQVAIYLDCAALSASAALSVTRSSSKAAAKKRRHRGPNMRLVPSLLDGGQDRESSSRD